MIRSFAYISLFLSLLICSNANADTVKVRDIEIKIPDKENLIYLKRTENEAYSTWISKMYIEKTKDNNFKSAVFYLTGNITSHISAHRVFLDEYYFRKKDSLLNDETKFNLYIKDQKGFGGLFVREMNLKKYNKNSEKYEILKNIWNYSSQTDTHTIETHIYRLRQKIKNQFKDNNFIKNSKNGYYL